MIIFKQLNYPILIRALRLLIALTVGYTASCLLQTPAGWVMMTVSYILFDQDTVGGTLSRGTLRFLATFLAGAVSIIYLLLFPGNTIILWIVIIVVNLFYAYFFMGTKKSYIGLLGSATVSMLLISEHPDLQSAIYRVVDITIGGIAALLSMILFFPEYAVKKLRTLTTKSLQNIAHLIRESKTQPNHQLTKKYILTFETSFINQISALNKAIEDARIELKLKRKSEQIEQYIQYILQIRRLYRLIIIIFYYEMDDEKLKDQKLNQVFDQILFIMKHLTHTTKTIIYAENMYDKLSQFTNNLEDNGLRKIITNFINELKSLNKLLANNDSQRNRLDVLSANKI